MINTEGHAVGKCCRTWKVKMEYEGKNEGKDEGEKDGKK